MLYANSVSTLIETNTKAVKPTDRPAEEEKEYTIL